MKIAVLGCGPAGLMAAHGLADQGMSFTVFSKKRKSTMYGAQFLHRPIPDMTPRDSTATIEYRLRGTAEGYRRKVYGPQWDGTVSPQDFNGNIRAWDIRTTYDNLWDKYQVYIKDVEIDPGVVRKLMASGWTIVNSIPKPALCYQGHDFAATEINAAGDAPDLGIDIGSMYRCLDDTVVCDGTPDVAWYRMSKIYGHTTIEWPGRVMVPVMSAARVRKPIRHWCDCWPDMIDVGRYGTWTKGVLSHDAYFKMIALCEEGVLNATA